MKFIVPFICLILSSVSVFGRDAKKIVFIGDSLTEGYGVEKQYAYPSLIQQKIQEDKKNYLVINGGVSGSTTASGLSRLKWFLKSDIAILVLALGGNDGLRGIKVEESEKNLKAIIELALQKKIKVFLAGMQIPPNYGKQYTEKFKSLYPNLSKKYSIELIPFILQDVGGIKELNLSDGIHPNKEGHKVVAATVYQYLKEFL